MRYLVSIANGYVNETKWRNSKFYSGIKEGYIIQHLSKYSHGGDSEESL